MTDHLHCTCCRHWRRFEQPSHGDLAADGSRTPTIQIEGEGHESAHDVVVGLLPPRPVVPLARAR